MQLICAYGSTALFDTACVWVKLDHKRCRLLQVYEVDIGILSLTHTVDMNESILTVKKYFIDLEQVKY